MINFERLRDLHFECRSLLLSLLKLMKIQDTIKIGEVYPVYVKGSGLINADELAVFSIKSQCFVEYHCNRLRVENVRIEGIKSQVSKERVLRVSMLLSERK